MVALSEFDFGVSEEPMQEKPHRPMSTNATSIATRVVAVVLVMACLIVSPLFTLQIFHPDGASVQWPMRIEYLIDVQISQLEPLMLSLAVLWYLLVHRTVSSQLLCFLSVVTLHIFLAFCLIAIRGEGVLRWLN